jgi:hypothetical protein
MTTRLRLLAALSFRCYPPWWRERYETEATHVVDGLLEEGSSGWAVACSFAWAGLQSRLRSAPLEFRPPAAATVRRNGARVLSAWALFIPLAWVAFGLGGFDPVQVIEDVVQSMRWQAILWDTAGTTRLELVAFVPLVVGALLFILWVGASALTTAWRAVRQRDLRALALSFVPIGLPAVIYLIGFCDLGELQISFGGFAPAQLFARLLTFSMGSMTSSVAPQAPVVAMATLSWLALLLSVGLASWSLHRARGRVGLAPRFLRSESFVSVVTAAVMSVSWILFVICGIVSLSSTVPVSRMVPACIVCSEAGIGQPSGPFADVAWWVIVACMGLVSLRASVSARQSLRRSGELVALPR